MARPSQARLGLEPARVALTLAGQEERAMRRRRMPGEVWRATIRRQVWARDGGCCRGPYCVGAPPLPLDAAHIDHITPLSKGGTNELTNLRTLCRRCHVLRAGREHQGMIAGALRDGVIPPDWRPLVWDDAETSVSADD